MIALVAISDVSFSEPFKELWERIARSGPHWIIAIVVFVVSLLLAKLVRRIVQKIVGRTSTAGHVDLLVSRGAAALVIIVGVILALSELGMSLSAALATVGLASVGIGFALQDVLSNLFAGIILLVQHPFTIGDQIKVADHSGIVENVRVRDTQLLTYEGERIFIPNKMVFNNPIINYSSTPTLRMDVRLPIKRPADVEAARKISIDALALIQGVLEQPTPLVLVESGEDSVVLVLRFWVESEQNAADRIRSDVVEKVSRKLEAGGIP